MLEKSLKKSHFSLSKVDMISFPHSVMMQIYCWPWSETIVSSCVLKVKLKAWSTFCYFSIASFMTPGVPILRQQILEIAFRITANVRLSCLETPPVSKRPFTLTSIRIRNTTQFWEELRNCIVVLEEIFQVYPGIKMANPIHGCLPTVLYPFYLDETNRWLLSIWLPRMKANTDV